MTMILTIASAQSISATGPTVPVRCNKSPFLGGQNHNALLINNAAVGGSGVIKIQGNPLVQDAAPADNDAGWVDIATLNAASPLEQEILLPSWIRANVTTAGTGNATIALEGVQ